MDKQKVETRQTITTTRQSVNYKPFTQPKNIVINRVSLSPGTSMSTIQKTRSSASFGLGAQLQSGVLGNISHQGVASMKLKREGEKKEMQDLNERLAHIIEQARFLEAENKALRDALNRSKKEFDPEPLKQMYQAEINEAKKLLDDANNDNGNLKVRINTLEDELEDLRAQLRHANDVNDQLQNNIDTLNDDIARRIADNEMLKRKVQELERQLADWKAKYAHVDTQLQGLRIDLQEETCQRLAESTRAQALEEELNFLRSVTDAEIKEYKAMLMKEDTVPQMRDYWTNELSKCMREIREEYDNQLNLLSADLESKYQVQLNEIRLGATKGNAESAQATEENRRLRSQITDKDSRLMDLQSQIDKLNAQVHLLTSELDSTTAELDNEKTLRLSEVQKLNMELEGVIKELQLLMDAKLSLELEIAAYRKLLEVEENRLSIGGMTQVVGGFRGQTEDALANILERSSQSFEASSSIGESGSTAITTGRVTMQRSSKGVISIAEVDNGGRYVTLENTSTSRMKRLQNLKGWKIKRDFLETTSLPSFTFEYVINRDFTLDAQQNIKIWAKNFEKDPEIKGNDIVCTVSDWGQVNRNSLITLFDDNGVEKATLSVKVNL